MVSFQNCSPGFYMQRSGSGDFASAAACEGALKISFSKTYYPLLSTTCNQCHVTGGPGNGQFADPNMDLAYPQFMAKGYLKINQVAKGSHYFPASAIPTNTSTIDGFTPDWLAAYGNYMSCMTSGGAGGGAGAGGQALQTIAKKGPANIIPATAPANGVATYVTITWDLETESMAPSIGLYKATMSLDVRPYYRNGAVTGFEFRNPLLKLKAGNTTQFYAATGLNIGINGTMADITTFDAVSGIASTAAGTNLAPGSTAFYEFAGASANTTFDLRFDAFSVSTTAGTGGGTGGTGGGGAGTVTGTVTFTSLTTGTAKGAVFANSCVSCHNAGNARGNLNLTNYAMAAASADLILNRMKSTTNPMPPGGLLPEPNPKVDDPRDVIQQWISTGKPQ